ncbi:hypothetical protein [Prosthecobacter sp.]|uniref:hypothetical protein n=1 Tax=Prosthecobacter sp. TaxID=1965333 RepID=UPI0025E830A3|nr:hypothetical protein [Prosthecobacter sp.]
MIDLNKHVVDGHARANLRGIAGVVLSPVSVRCLSLALPFEALGLLQDEERPKKRLNQHWRDEFVGFFWVAVH